MTGVWDPAAPPILTLTWEAVEAYLRTEGLPDGVLAYEGPEIPDLPSPFLVGTWYPGPGFTTEAMFDAVGLQIRSVGIQNDVGSAKELADRVDHALTRRRDQPGDVRPWQLGGVTVLEIRRSGPGPVSDQTDDARRTHMVCSYVIEHASNG